MASPHAGTLPEKVCAGHSPQRRMWASPAAVFKCSDTRVSRSGELVPEREGAEPTRCLKIVGASGLELRPAECTLHGINMSQPNRSTRIRSITEDREGNLGWDERRVVESPAFAVVESKDRAGLPFETVRSLCEDGAASVGRGTKRRGWCVGQEACAGGPVARLDRCAGNVRGY